MPVRRPHGSCEPISPGEGGVGVVVDLIFATAGIEAEIVGDDSLSGGPFGSALLKIFTKMMSGRRRTDPLPSSRIPQGAVSTLGQPPSGLDARCTVRMVWPAASER